MTSLSSSLKLKASSILKHRWYALTPPTSSSSNFYRSWTPQWSYFVKKTKGFTLTWSTSSLILELIILSYPTHKWSSKCLFNLNKTHPRWHQCLEQKETPTPSPTQWVNKQAWQWSSDKLRLFCLGCIRT